MHSRTLQHDSSVKPYIAWLDDEPVGFIQSYVAIECGDGWWADETDPGTDPHPANTRAIRCYEKVGFRRVGDIETPDGSALLMIVERPTC